MALDTAQIDRMLANASVQISQAAGSNIDVLMLAEHVIVQDSLKTLDPHSTLAQDIIFNRNVSNLYQYVDMMHKSGKLLSEVFPQNLIDSLVNKHTLIIDAEKQKMNLALELTEQIDKHYVLTKEINELNNTIEELRNKCDNLDTELQNKLDKLKLEEKLKGLKVQIAGEKQKAKSIKHKDIGNIFATTTPSGKLNIFFAVIITLTILGIIANMTLKNQVINNKKLLLDHDNFNRRILQ